MFFPTKLVCAFLVSSILLTCPAVHRLLDINILVIPESCTNAEVPDHIKFLFHFIHLNYENFLTHFAFNWSNYPVNCAGFEVVTYFLGSNAV
jgi:hypothetical protein